MPFFVPHFLAYLLNFRGIANETIKWGNVLRIEKHGLSLFCYLVIMLKEFRSYLYFRSKVLSLLTEWYAPGQPALYFHTKPNMVGRGLVIQHGFSSIINAQSVGKNCQIWQNVTIGKGKPGGEKPVIGDDVKIFAGAIVIGSITIGNKVSIGAGSVVVKSIPDNCVVVGNPARIIKKNGMKVDIVL